MNRELIINAPDPLGQVNEKLLPTKQTSFFHALLKFLSNLWCEPNTG